MTKESEKKEIEWRKEMLSGYVKKAWFFDDITSDVADYLLKFIDKIDSLGSVDKSRVIIDGIDIDLDDLPYVVFHQGMELCVNPGTNRLDVKWFE